MIKAGVFLETETKIRQKLWTGKKGPYTAFEKFQTASATALFMYLALIRQISHTCMPTIATLVIGRYLTDIMLYHNDLRL